MANGIPVLSEESLLPSTVDWTSCGIEFVGVDSFVTKGLEMLSNPRRYARVYELASEFSKNPMFEVKCRDVIKDVVRSLGRRGHP
jgi:hypothetical protein